MFNIFIKLFVKSHANCGKITALRGLLRYYFSHTAFQLLTTTNEQVQCKQAAHVFLIASYC